VVYQIIPLIWPKAKTNWVSLYHPCLWL